MGEARGGSLRRMHRGEREEKEGSQGRMERRRIEREEVGSERLHQEENNFRKEGKKRLEKRVEKTWRVRNRTCSCFYLIGWSTSAPK